MNPTAIFFLIAFGIPWIGWSAIAVAGDHLTVLQRTMLFYSGDACSIAGMVATYLQGGTTGLKQLWQRCRQLQAPPWLWLFMIAVPLAIALASVYVWGLQPGHVVGNPSLLAFFTTPALFRSLLSGPLGEELGWRGFLLPKLLTKVSPLAASVVLGVIWGVWHLPLYVHSIFATVSGAAGFIVTTICYSIIMTMLYNYSRGSVFIAVAFHWFMNTIPNAVFHVFGNVYWPLVANQMIFGYCIVAVIVVLVFGKDLRREVPAVPAIA
jgi:uncharacterized protein